MDGVIQPILTSQQQQPPQESQSQPTSQLVGQQLNPMPPERNRPNILAIDADSLPHGWERVIDENHGIYYIDHNNQRTQYERPYEIELTKSVCGFGFTLVEAEKGLLTVRNIIHGGPAHLNGVIQPGDVLVSVVGVSISGLQHTDVARLFARFAVGDCVKLTFARGTNRYTDPSFLSQDYLIADSINSGNNNLIPSSASLQDYPLVNGFHNHQPVVIENNNFDLVSVSIKKGAKGFGFTISDASSGQKVKIILDNERCLNLRQGDILMSLNGEDISNLSHKEVVEALKQCVIDQEATLVVKRKRRFRSKTPLDMHSTDAIGFHNGNILPQRNCKTPSLEVMMMHRNNDSSEWAGGLDSNPRIQWTSLANFNGFSGHPGPTVEHHTNYSNGNNLNQSTTTTSNTIPMSSSASITTISNETTRPPDTVNALVPPATAVSSAATVSSASYCEEPDDLYQNSRELQQHAIASKMPSDIYENGAHLLLNSRQPNVIPAPIEPIYSPANQHSVGGDQSWHSSYVSSAPQLPPIPHQKPLNRMNSYTTTNNTATLTNELGQPQMGVPYQFNYQDPLYSNTMMMGFTHRPMMNDDLQILPTPDDRISTTATATTITTNENIYGSQPPIVDYRSQYYINNDNNNNISSDVNAIPHHLLPPPVMINNDDHMIDPIEGQARLNVPITNEEYEYHVVVLGRGESGFGFRIMGGAEADRIISIGSIVIGGVAHKNGKLKAGDEIISINNHDVLGATHKHVVDLMSACTTSVNLLVRRKKYSDAYDVVLSRSMDEGFGFVIISCGNCALIGKIIPESPADRCKRLHVRDRIIAVNGRDITASMTHPAIVNMIKDSGATLRLRIIPSNCYSVEIIRSVKGFGFSIRGGADIMPDGMPLYILRVALDGPAQDLLNVGDEIIEINNISTVGMTHKQAVTIISHSDPLVKLKLRRNYETPRSLLDDAPPLMLPQSQQGMASANLIPAYSLIEPNQMMSNGYAMNDKNGASLISTALPQRITG